MKSVRAQNEFGDRLRRLRKQRKINLRSLGKLSGTPFPYLSLIENGKRGTGAALASKLADGLKLTGDERDEFLVAADKTVTPIGRKRATSGCPPFLAELFAKRIEQLVGCEAARIANFEARHLQPVHETPSNMPASIFVGHLEGARPAPLKRRLTENLLAGDLGLVIAVILHCDGRQSVIRCKAETF